MPSEARMRIAGGTASKIAGGAKSHRNAQPQRSRQQEKIALRAHAVLPICSYVRMGKRSPTGRGWAIKVTYSTVQKYNGLKPSSQIALPYEVLQLRCKHSRGRQVLQPVWFCVGKMLSFVRHCLCLRLQVLRRMRDEARRNEPPCCGRYARARRRIPRVGGRTSAPHGDVLRPCGLDRTLHSPRA